MGADDFGLNSSSETPWGLDASQTPDDSTSKLLVQGQKVLVASGQKHPKQAVAELQGIGIHDPTHEAMFNALAGTSPEDKLAMSKENALIDQQQAELDKEKERYANRGFFQKMNWAPVAEWANAQQPRGSTPMGTAGYVPPPTDEQARQLVFGQQQGLLKDKLTMLQAQNAANKNAAMMGLMYGRLNQGDQRLALMGDRTAMAGYKDITNDPIVQGATQQLNKIRTDHQTLMDAVSSGRPIPIQKAKELALGLGSALAGTGGRGVGYNLAHGQEYSSLEGSLNNLEQVVSGNPKDALTPGFKQELEYTLNRLEGYYQKYAYDQAQRKIKAFPGSTPQMRAARAGAAAQYPASSVDMSQPAAPQTKTVNGVTYKKAPGGWVPAE